MPSAVRTSHLTYTGGPLLKRLVEFALDNCENHSFAASLFRGMINTRNVVLATDTMNSPHSSGWIDHEKFKLRKISLIQRSLNPVQWLWRALIAHPWERGFARYDFKKSFTGGMEKEKKYRRFLQRGRNDTFEDLAAIRNLHKDPRPMRVEHIIIDEDIHHKKFYAPRSRLICFFAAGASILPWLGVGAGIDVYQNAQKLSAMTIEAGSLELNAWRQGETKYVLSRESDILGLSRTRIITQVDTYQPGISKNGPVQRECRTLFSTSADEISPGIYDMSVKGAELSSFCSTIWKPTTLRFN